MASAEDVAGTGAIPPVLFCICNLLLDHPVTSRKDWLTTKNRFVTDLSLIRQRRTTARKNITALRTSNLLKLLRPTWRRSKIITYQTMEDHNQEENWMAEDLLPSEPTQTDMEEEQGYPHL